MSEHLSVTVDKFTFRVATDRLYNPEGVWAKAEGNGRFRLGLSDFVQQHSGDVTFAQVRPVGTAISHGEEVAVVETIKATIGVPSPVSGVVGASNPELASRPEVINLDPYGQGWLAVIDKGSIDRGRVLDPEVYLSVVKGQAEREVGGS